MRVFLMDLLCVVPYYVGYLVQALREAGVDAVAGSITYDLDQDCFARLGLHNDAGLLDVVARRRIRSDSLRRMMKLLEFAANSGSLAARFLFRRPHILHVQYIPLTEKDLPFERWFLRYAKNLGIRIVYTAHNVLPQDTGDRLKGAYRKVYRLADGLMCHNEAARMRLIEEFGIPADRIWVIPHGPLLHDTRRPSPHAARLQLGISATECLILWQGIVKPYKGIEFLLDAWREMRSRDVPAKLVIAGTGEESLLRTIADKVRALGVKDSVVLDWRFLTVEELSQYYQAADIVVYPYKEITTSGALMTGVAYRKAMVATNLPPFQELLRDGENAALVEFGDTQALARILERLVLNPTERARLQEGVAKCSSEVSWAEIARQTIACYETVVRRHS